MRLLPILAAFAIAVPVFAQVDVNVNALKGNDTIVFKAFNGSPEMKKQVAGDLNNCGWFDVLQGGASTYIVSGSANGNSVRLDLADGAGAPIASFTGTGASAAEASGRAVDAMLSKLYKIPGICRSRIAFAVEIGPMLKEIYICNYDGSGIQRITHNNGLSVDPVWNPSGRTIVYGFIGKSYTILMEHDLLSGKMRQLARFRGINAGGKISPDGSKIALVLSKDNQVDLYVRNLNGTSLTRLTNDRAVEASPCWSPDGRKICYVSDSASGRPRLRVISANGGSSQSIRAMGSESVSPSWSADDKVVYSARVGNYMIGVADVSGGKAKRPPQQLFNIIPTKGGNWESPSWAPDNRHAVCSYNGGIWIVDTWSGKTHRIVSGSGKCSLPDWSSILK